MWVLPPAKRLLLSPLPRRLLLTRRLLAGLLCLLGVVLQVLLLLLLLLLSCCIRCRHACHAGSGCAGHAPIVCCIPAQQRVRLGEQANDGPDQWAARGCRVRVLRMYTGDQVSHTP